MREVGVHAREAFRRRPIAASLEKFQQSIEPYREDFYKEVIGRFDLPLANAQSAHAQGVRRAEVHRLRSGARRLSRRVRLRHSAAAQGHQAGRAAAGGRLPARAGRAAAGRGRSARSTIRPITASPPAGRAGLHRLRAAEPVHLQGPLPHAAAEGQPAGQDAVLDHRAAAPADRRLAGDAAVRRSRADRLLRPVLRRQDARCACRRW